MTDKPLAQLSLKIDPAALQAIIANGDLLKFSEAVAAQAAAQITAQIVWNVAEAQKSPQAVLQGSAVDIAFHQVLIDGEPGYGTGRFPPRPVVTLGSATE